MYAKKRNEGRDGGPAEEEDWEVADGDGGDPGHPGVIAGGGRGGPTGGFVFTGRGQSCGGKRAAVLP